MKTNRIIILTLLLCSLSSFAQRTTVLLNDGWNFRFSHQVEPNSATPVTIPHTWNTDDALSGKLDYKRGIGNYERTLHIDKNWQGKRLFLRFDGVNSIANVFINGKHIGEHRGGYSAFVFEITNVVNYGADNALWVRVNNAEQLDVMPLVGDFNIYGGIYRDVTLMITDPVCISPLDYASSGVYLTQTKVTDNLAEISAKINLSNRGKCQKIKAKIEVKDQNTLICKAEKNIKSKADTDSQITIPFNIENPHLWNARQDPFMYQVEITISDGAKIIDKITQPLGLRYFHIDPEKGFFLNGKHLKLRGVCRHQDRAKIGNALENTHHRQDLQLITDMGANAVRLAHYQQSEYVYQLADSLGLIVWAEIPFVGPGGYLDKGFVDQPSFCENGRQQLRELIRQNYNHPSICFWGLFNELKEQGDNPISYIKELNALAHQEDPTRPTTSASNQDGAINHLTDCIAWNKYDGWYGGMPNNLARFLDATHTNHPELRIGISEYGAGASILHQQDTLVRPVPVSDWHPENWQTFYHIENWKIIAQRPFVWGSFVWNMFDFGAAHRHEGDRLGINDKGLVTFDRQTPKDAYYFYKANWNPAPMLHLANKRCTERTKIQQDFMAFSNADSVALFVNDKFQGIAHADEYNTLLWQNITLEQGTNTILVRSLTQPALKDEMTIEIK